MVDALLEEDICFTKLTCAKFPQKTFFKLSAAQVKSFLQRNSPSLELFLFQRHRGIPSRELTYPTLGKGKSSSKDSKVNFDGIR